MMNRGRSASAGSLNSQLANKRAAFLKLIQTDRFKNWHRLKTAQMVSQAHSIEEMIERSVEAQMTPDKLKIEIGDGYGKWIEVK